MRVTNAVVGFDYFPSNNCFQLKSQSIQAKPWFLERKIMEKYELFSADTYKKIKTFFQLWEHTFCAMEALFFVNGSNFLSVVQFILRAS
jgi:hypothetical protein